MKEKKMHVMAWTVGPARRQEPTWPNRVAGAQAGVGDWRCSPLLACQYTTVRLDLGADGAEQLALEEQGRKVRCVAGATAYTPSRLRKSRSADWETDRQATNRG
jgi:hypothetical protein